MQRRPFVIAAHATAPEAHRGALRSERVRGSGLQGLFKPPCGGCGTECVRVSPPVPPALAPTGYDDKMLAEELANDY